MKNIQKNIILAPYTTYRVGGPADFFIEARTRYELMHSILYALEKGIPYFILGLGANVLISDTGFRGLVIVNAYRSVAIRDNRVKAGSGAIMEHLIDATADRGLSGFEHFAGIPSTVGGALWQNLHFLNHDRTRTMFISEVFRHATTLNVKTGQENLLFAEHFAFGYDRSILHEGNHVVLDAVFELEEGDPSLVRSQAQKNLAWRNERHPPVATEFSCGSVFKKVVADGKEEGAGRFIDRAGLKGYVHGGATVSMKHANFITHTGEATAADIMSTIQHVQCEVLEKTRVMLEPEIRFIGEF